MGLLLKVVVDPANIQDREGAGLLLDGIIEQFPRLSTIWADQGYNGATLRNWVDEKLGCSLLIPRRRQEWAWAKEGDHVQPAPAFPILPRR